MVCVKNNQGLLATIQSQLRIHVFFNPGTVNELEEGLGETKHY